MKATEKRKIKGHEVTFLGFGALEIGRDWGFVNRTRPEETEALALIQEVLDSGVNLIDTASAYHLSEERIGKFIKSNGKKFFLASKCGEHNRDNSTYYDFSYQAVKESIKRSLKLLNVEELDLLQIHFGPNAEQVIKDGETYKAMAEAKSVGKVKLLGASIDGALAKECILSGNFDCMQMTYNLLDTSNFANLQLCKEKNIGVLIKGPFAQGKLTPKVFDILAGDKLQPKERAKLTALLEACNNDADILMNCALQLLYREEAISSVLAGTKSIHHFHNNIKLLETPLDEKIFQAVKRIAFAN
ncbi:MAG: aldo/keto reductase [Erysipelotrichales bacterium]|nr:aldo/keto reductase [Erysipelotrichales bacterium]